MSKKVTGSIIALTTIVEVTVNNSQKGISLLEVLVAILMISIGILGLINLQSVIMMQLDSAKKQYQGERVAFQLLDIYPDSIAVNLPVGWSYQVINENFNMRCQRVKVIIQPDLGKKITQERWFCR